MTIAPAWSVTCTAGEARSRITSAYLDYARYYIAARGGMLDAAPDPEYW